MLTQERTDNFVRNYFEVEAVLGATGPAWLKDLRTRAMRAYSEFGLPTTRDEEFKYTSFKWLEEKHYAPAFGATVTRGEIENLPLGKVAAATLVFVNGEFAPELNTEYALPEGVFVGALSELPSEFEPLVQAHLTKVATFEGKLGSTNDPRFIDLNTAFLGDTAVVVIPKSVAVETPIHLLYVTQANHGAIAVHPRVLVVVGENAEAKIIESNVALGGHAFVNGVTEIVVGANARLEHVKFQHESLETASIMNLAIHQEAGSVFTSNVATFGGRVGRVDINVWLNGSHTETWLNGMAVGKGEQVLDHHTRIDHAKPECNSFEVYKNVLDDRAKGIFNGKIFVYEDAQKTDAKQTNQAILLSPEASIDTKPQLEIFADDVKCTHGATVGQLREDALFYLRARGIPLKEARSLLVYAFAAEVLEKISIEPVRDELEALLFDKLGA